MFRAWLMLASTGKVLATHRRDHSGVGIGQRKGRGWRLTEGDWDTRVVGVAGCKCFYPRWGLRLLNPAHVDDTEAIL
ncbi:hypothetical protein OF83DRAFT_1100609 [Amylostereum chailletii]|nr:hypothetical protein OF83DRAFT_1100609 [Amylostereum chailletii]